jgi:hypothetical protein
MSLTETYRRLGFNVQPGGTHSRHIGFVGPE